MPSNPARKAVRCLPSNLEGSWFQNTKEPGTAHSPGSAAFSNTKVSDGSRRMVRNNFIGGDLRAWRHTKMAPRARKPRPCARLDRWRSNARASRHFHQGHAAHLFRAIVGADTLSSQR